VDNNDPNAGLIAGRGANEQLISQEAIQSFEALTHNAKAEYGRNSGGIVSIISKSGTNEFHGSVYEYHNNSALTARNGKPASYLRRVGNPRIGLRRTEWHSFAQNDWRVTQSLTLNIGLRYELNTSLREVADRIPSQFLLNTDRNNLALRFGFAWHYRACQFSCQIGGGYFFTSARILA
jgi:outer membrane receptor for ferrienterochelin and colicin